MYESDLHKLKPIIGYSCANVVSDSKLAFTTCELEGADATWSLFKALGMPSYLRFIYVIERNLIKNCPVTIPDVSHALHIYGPKLATIKGKKTKKPKHFH